MSDINRCLRFHSTQRTVTRNGWCLVMALMPALIGAGGWPCARAQATATETPTSGVKAPSSLPAAPASPTGVPWGVPARPQGIDAAPALPPAQPVPTPSSTTLPQRTTLPKLSVPARPDLGTAAARLASEPAASAPRDPSAAQTRLEVFSRGRPAAASAQASSSAAAAGKLATESEALRSRALRGYAAPAAPRAPRLADRLPDPAALTAQAVGHDIVVCNGENYVVPHDPARKLDGPDIVSFQRSRITFGGSVVLTGRCFGNAPGRVRLVGNFPGGALTLRTPVWKHDVVYAEIPPMTPGAPPILSHQVLIQLLDARGKAGNEQVAEWETPMQRVEVASRKVWTATGCDAPTPSASGCQAANRLEAGPATGSRIVAALEATRDPVQPTAIGAFHRRLDYSNRVFPFSGRDSYAYAGPASCSVEATQGWSNGGEHGVPSSFRPTHPDARSLVVEWTADYCVMWGWALDHDWRCEASYSSTTTVLSCPAGTVVP